MSDDIKAEAGPGEDKVHDPVGSGRLEFRWCGACDAVTGVRYPGIDWVALGKRHAEWHKRLEARLAAVEQAAGLRPHESGRGGPQG